MTNFSNWSGKLNYLKYLVIGLIALFIASCTTETDTTSPALVNNGDPVLFDVDNVANAIYGNSGQLTGYVANGEVNPNFTNEAGYSFGRLEFNDAELTDGADLSGESVTTGLDDVDSDTSGDQAAYTYDAGEADDEVGGIAINLLTPTNTSVISLVAVFTNVTNGAAGIPVLYWCNKLPF